ncbi:hypothetical protein FRB94_013865 [Tulasnella sp. JGI-2019a]|nr:hypothetical protein FRB93_008473 [Tulasnella sp. JGI-2019a]KAG9007918.1 hypothetical protein FRB94_013865 [Tulasnella sp. JGI-2019a]KAG9033409.1 hypothetical protein FRB95_014857 [Tulasnella sp. JGI-2019a]
MAGPNLELFKFGVYVFFPVAIMLHYGNPDWYIENILPYRERFWPSPSVTASRIPHNSTELQNELERLKSRRLEERQRAQAIPPTSDSS